MNGTKKTLTTLSAAAALALGGIAIAQTGSYSADNQAGAQLGSSATMQNESDSSTLNNDTSTLGAGSSTLGSDTTLSNQPGDSMPVAQMDRG